MLRWVLAGVYFVFAMTLLILRYGVLPNIDAHRSDLERALADSLGLKVAISSIDADWQGLNPRLALHGVQVFDDAGRPALSFDNVEAVVSWLSLPLWSLRLDRLSVQAPTLALRRDVDGTIYVAGLALRRDAEGGGLADWLLEQHGVVVRDATLRWTDLLRGAPPLELRNVNLRLENTGSRHRFGLTAAPPAGLAAAIDLRGDLRGRDLKRLDSWRGEAYARLDYADLAVWRRWIDYPFELPAGSGALRLWLAWTGGHLDAATADLALADVRLRVQPELPELHLASLRGRLTAAMPPDKFEIGAQRLALASREGPLIPSLDFSLRWQDATRGNPARGELSGDGIELAALARLAAHFPLGAALRERLVQAQPRGRLADLKLAWTGTVDAPRTYSLRTRLDGFGINAGGSLPGCIGLSGYVEANEKGGKLSLASRNAALLLPQVFPEPLLAIDQMTGQASWTVVGDGVEIQLPNLAFANPDAAGSVHGRYRFRPGAPGEIDLSARLTRANASAVARYMPHVTLPEVRAWLRHAIVAGRSDDTRLRLKGDLSHFPFNDRRLGSFQVSGRFAGAVLRVGPGWPEMKEVAGELLFEGSRMLITAHRAVVGGVKVSAARAEIPDLAASEALIEASGTASGQTSDFLRYVSESPVADWIDHFTDDIGARGNAHLELALSLPLARLEQSRARGEFVFANNQLSIGGLPPLEAASARVQFSESRLAIREGSATLLGSPLSLTAQTQDGAVNVALQGSASTTGLRQVFDTPLLDHVSGSAAWRGGIRLHRNRVDVQIDSDLLGIASSLPEPFNKGAGEALALNLERSTQPDVTVMARGGKGGTSRETIKLRLGDVVRASFWRRTGASGGTLERGVIGLNEVPLAAPERGVLVGGHLNHLDLDGWRRTLRAEASAAPLPVSALDLRAAAVTAFGQSLSDFSIAARLADGSWQADVKSRELTGKLRWDQAGKGVLSARLKHLAMTELKSHPVPEESGQREPDVKELPGVDVVADAFSLRGRELGRLELKSENEAHVWQIRHLKIESPDGSLSANGQWRPGAASGATGLAFRIESSDSGKLLDRLGYGNAIKRGNATLEGKVGWVGPPTSIDFPTLEGNMTIEVGRGQFAKLEPGVGRLLGVLNLQSLPRRITLDFRDVFSEGFAFDSISGSIAMKRGVLETRDLRIQGPSAKVLMTGQVSLGAETQDLKVRVQPALSETVAIGAAVVNPVAGAVTYLAQKVLKDPFEQMFAYEYAVTGAWNDPKVEKLASRAPAGAAPQP